MNFSPREDITITFKEAKILSKLTSVQFGLIKNDSTGIEKRVLLEKAVACLDNLVIQEAKALTEAKQKSVSESCNSPNRIPLNPLVYLYLGHFNLLLERVDDAFSAYKEYYERSSPFYSGRDSHFLYGYGLCFFRFDCYLKAINLFKDVLFLDRFFVRISDVYFRLGFSYSIKHRFTDQAIRHFQRALVETESSPLSRFDVIFQIACLFERQNKIPQALEFYHEVLSQGKSSLVASALHYAYLKLGYLYQKLFEEAKEPVQHFAEKAIQYYRAAIDIDSTNAKTWYYLGRVYAALGSIHEAFMTFRHSIDNAEADADTWCSIGTLYQQQNQSCDALQAYFCAIQIENEHASAWKNLGVLYESTHQYPDALRCYQRAIAADKDQLVCSQEFRDRVKQMADQMSEIGDKHLNAFIAELPPQQKLPPVDEASQLPIPVELTQRRMMLHQQAEQFARNAGGQVAATLYQSNGHGIYGPATSQTGSGLNSSSSNVYQEYYGYSSFASQGMLMAHGPSTTANAAYPSDMGHQRLKSDPLSNVNPSMEQQTYADAVPLNVSQIQWMQQLQSLPQPTPIQRQQLQQLQTQYARSQMYQRQHHNAMIAQQQLPPPQHPPTLQPTSYSHQTKDSVIVSGGSTEMETSNVDLPQQSVSSHSDPFSQSNQCPPPPQHSSTHQPPSSSSSVPHTSVIVNTNNNVTASNNENLIMDFDPVGVPDEFLNAWNTEEDLFKQFNNCLDGNGGLDMDVLFENNADAATMNTLGLANLASTNATTNQAPSNFSNPQNPSSNHENRSMNQSISTNHPQSSNMNHDNTPLPSVSSHTPHTPAGMQANTPNTPHRHGTNPGPYGGSETPASVPSNGALDIAATRGSVSEQSSNHDNCLRNTASESTQNPDAPVPSLLAELIRINHPDALSDAIAPREPAISMSSTEILECMKTAGRIGQRMWPSRYLPKREPIPRPPEKPFPSFPNLVTKEESSKISQPHPLLPSVPALYLETKKEVESDLVQEYCFSMPAVIIRNICHILRMDMTFFSSKHLAEQNPSHLIEIRRQTLQGPLDNVDSSGRQVWHCESSRVRSTIKEYAEYQARHFMQAKRGERRLSFTQQDAIAAGGSSKSHGHGQLRFGTNCDLSDHAKWTSQIDELSKLPAFLRVKGPQSMLSYVGYDILGMNTVQLYMKVPGCRTPGHQENLGFCSVNINTGPGDCEWFCVAEQYWGEIYRMCNKNKVDYLKGSWWPNLEELLEAGIPVYRFVQRPGDLVWINTNTVHWVQSNGFCNNVAWNVGPLTGEQYEAALERYEFNQWDQFKSIVPMITLTWNMARDLVVADRKLYELMRYTMMRCIIRLKQAEELLHDLDVEINWHGHQGGDLANYCDQCDEEVFGLILTKREEDNLYHPYCLPCSLRIDRTLSTFIVLAEYTLADLQETYDKFTFHREPIPAFSVGRS